MDIWIQFVGIVEVIKVWNVFMFLNSVKWIQRTSR